ncbi:MAG: helix-turn-helix transcriptional regulator [Deltaproteobacteria bacterium]|nr:helix-turn-helix transcriptional regulator [Deltaproteobacteria bacterium]
MAKDTKQRRGRGSRDDRSTVREAPSDPGKEASPSSVLRAAGTPKGDELGAAELARRVADSLRRIRKVRGLSLDQLASSSGVSRAALSQIEGARTNPTLAVLWKIAVGLGVPFGALLGEQAEQRCRLLRAEDISPLRSVDGRVESRLLTPAGASPGLETYELRFAPRGLLASEAHGSGTHETIYLLTGALRMVVGDETFDLLPGDAFHFRADIAHSYENRSSRDARFLNQIQYGDEE